MTHFIVAAANTKNTTISLKEYASSNSVILISPKNMKFLKAYNYKKLREFI